MNKLIIDRNDFGIFYRQQEPNLCGVATLQTELLNLFPSHSKHKVPEDQRSLKNLLEKLYREKFKEKHGNKPEHNNYVINEKNGTDVYHFRNIAEYCELGAFTKFYGEIDNLKYLLDNGIWPIIHRPYLDDKGKIDGHYVLIYNYNHSMQIFDPDSETGGLIEEPYNIFDSNWRYPNPESDEKWFIFLYEQNKVKIPFKGKYL